MKLRLLSVVAVFATVLFLAPSTVRSQALTGSKVISTTGGDYTSLAAAITDLNTKGASGTVTFLINSDLSETGSPEITTVTLNGANRLVIKPNTGKTPTVSFSACATSGNRSNAGLAVSGTSTNVGYITIDGSNTPNGTTRDMTFALNDTTNGRYCIRLNGETDNVTIKNLTIAAPGIKPTTASGSRTYGIFSNASATAAADSLMVTNCRIGSATGAFYYGIYKPDGSTAGPTANAVAVSRNTIFAQHKGMSIWGCAGVSSINNNSISVIGHPTGAYVQNSLNGIYVETWLGTVNIFNNKVVTLKAKALTQTTAKPLYGILIYNAGSPAGQTANIYNNFISDFSYTGDASSYGSEINGIAVDAADETVNVYFNTIHMNNATANPTYGIRVYDDAGQSVNIRNNIIVNTVNHDSAYAIHCNPIANACLKSSDNNDLVAAGANGNTGYYNGVKAKTLGAWQTATGKDASSKSVNPAATFGANGQLASVTDLHWVSAASAAFAGAPIAGYTTDIDGDTRNASKPYMGADEAGPLTGVMRDAQQTPAAFALGQNFPNPFNPSTTLRFATTSPALVSLRVYDALGREVATLVEDHLPAGTYSVRFEAGKLASGVYNYRLTAGAFTETRRMIIAK